MLLKKIMLNNIRSYEEAEVNFPNGFTLLSGDIGSGKTSILLAIEFALFGLQPGQRGASLLRNNASEGGTILEFEIEDNDVIIERTLKRSKTVSQDYCAITINNEKKEISVTELKNKVLELLNYPLEFSKKQNILYKFTVYTPQEEMKQIMLQDPETRVNTLRHVFGIDKYKTILENTSVIISKLREEKRKKEGMTINLEKDKFSLIEKEEELEVRQKNFSSVEKQLFLEGEKRKQIQEESKEINEKILKKKEYEKEIEKTELMISSKNQILLDNNKLIEELNMQIKELQELNFDDDKIIELENLISIEKSEKEKLNQKTIEISSQINSFIIKNDDNERLERKIANLEMCPTCLQEVDPVYRANILNKIHNDLSENKNKIQKLDLLKQEILQKIKEKNLSVSEKEKKVNELNIIKIKLQGIQEKQKRLNEIEQNNLKLKQDMDLLLKHIETLKSSSEELSKFQSIFERKQEELERALKQEKMIEIKMAELKKEIGFFSTQINELKERISETELIKKEFEYLSKLETWLSKEFIQLISYIEQNVMITLKKEFLDFFNNWFCMLVSDSFNVSLDDRFTPVIEQQDYEIDYAYLSGGERTAVALAYRLALNQVINKLMSKIKTRDLVILDEPTDGFSEQQLDKMRDVLQQLDVAQLILVSHEAKIEDFVENIIRFKKDRGVSRIE